MKIYPIPGRVRGLRTERAWSQEQLAEIAGVDVRTIQRIEANQPTSFETLKGIASAFNLDVKELLAPKKEEPHGDEPKPIFLSRVQTGSDLINIVGGSHAYRFSHDELEEGQVDPVASFFQDLQDYGDIWNDIEAGDRVRITYDFTNRIQELEKLGLLVFGLRTKARIKAGSLEWDDWRIATMYVTSSGNPRIIKLKPLQDTIPVKFS